MENKEIKIRRVPIEAVLEILHKLYDSGVDFVDFHGRIEEEEDELGISFSKEYINPDYSEGFDNILEKDSSNKEIKVKLSDDDLNQLL